MIAGASRLMEQVKEGRAIVIPLVVDLIVIVSAAFFGGAAINRLENVERAVANMSATNDRVLVLEQTAKHINKQLDTIESKLDKLLEKASN